MPHSHHQIPDHIAIRRIWPTEIPLYRDHLKRLDPDSRHSRFGGMISDSFIDTLTQSAYGPDVMIFGAFDGDRIVAAGELRLMLNIWPTSAEAAFSVEKDHQDHGIGDALFNRILLTAQNRNVNLITIMCLRENDRMRHLAQKHSAKLNFADGEISGELAPAWSSRATYFEEAIGEANGLVQHFFSWSMQHLPSPPRRTAIVDKP